MAAKPDKNCGQCTLLIKIEDLDYFSAENLVDFYHQIRLLPSSVASLHSEDGDRDPDHVHIITAHKFKNKKKVGIQLLKLPKVPKKWSTAKINKGEKY